jgi:hypothetical protein
MLNRCQGQRRTADLAALIAATGGLLARGRSGEDRRLTCKAISQVLYSPFLPPQWRPGRPGQALTSRAMALSSAVRCGPVTP